MTFLLLATLSAAFAGYTSACPDPLLLTTNDSVTVTTGALGDTIPCGGLSLKGVEPDEIDLASTCVPSIRIEGLVLAGVEPDEIDFDSEGNADLGEIIGQTTTAAHIMLGRQADPHGRLVEVEITGSLVLAPLEGSLHEEVVSKRPYQSVVVADLVFEVVEVLPDEPLDEIDGVRLSGSSTTAQGDELYPEVPICGHCKADIDKP